MPNLSISRPPFLAHLLVATLAVGTLIASAPDADAVGFGSKWGRSAKASAKAKTPRPARRGLFSKIKARRAASLSVSASSTAYLHPAPQQRRSRAVARSNNPTRPVESVSHTVARTVAPKAKPARKRPLLARLFAREPRVTRKPRVAKLAPGQPNAAQPAPKIDHMAIANRSSSSRTRVVINIAEQRAYVYLDGKIAVDTPVSTARSGKSTPRGNFHVGERVKQGKISTIYNVSMPYWMRLGSSPYGMHAGYLPGYPASAGCIRMPLDAAKAVYKATGYGTRIKIVSG